MRRSLATILTVVVLIATLMAVWLTRREDSSRIKIGAVLPLTGDAAAYGKSAQNGISLAIAQINSGGGVKGKEIEVAFEDCQATPRIAVGAINKLILQNHVPAVLGGIPSSVTLAMAPIAETQKVVLLSPSASAPAITNAGDYIFRTAPSDIFQGEVMADRALNVFHAPTVALLYINNDYGVGLKNTFGKRYRAQGGNVVLEEGYNPSTTDFRTLISKAKSLSPHGIYLVAQKEAGLILRNMAEANFKPKIFSTVLFEDPDILEAAGSAAEGVIYTFPAYDPQNPAPIVKEFRKLYSERYGADPDIFAALSFDATNILAQAMTSSGTSSAEIKKGLYGIKKFQGVMGETSFDSNGDVMQTVRLKTVQDGKFVFLPD